MKIDLSHVHQNERGSALVAYLLLTLVTVSALAGLGAYVAQTTNVTHRRNDMIAATEFAQAVAVVGCNDLNTAVLNKTGTLAGNLATSGYALSTALSTSQQRVYVRSITTLFSNQTVTAQIWLPNVASPTTGKIVATAVKGKSTRRATVNVQMGWAFPAAIISTHPGTKSAGVSKSQAQDGNVVISGGKSGSTIVDGGIGLAVLANGKVNIDNKSTVPPASVSQTNYNTANEIPDYTNQGSTNKLFDFARFVAVADRTTNNLNPTRNNHFTNLNTFFNAINFAWFTPAKALEGVIVVDISKTDSLFDDLDPSHLPFGINVRGTLFFKFSSAFGPLDKIINTASININPANLSGLVATNPATYTTGYPPVYYNNSKNPTNINISGAGFANISPTEDLPALVYSIGVLDIHGNANISGVVYTPSNFEIENKQGGQIQYFKGCLISGLGCYFENGSAAISIISYDAAAVDALISSATSGKQLSVTYWQ